MELGNQLGLGGIQMPQSCRVGFPGDPLVRELECVDQAENISAGTEAG